MLHALAVPYGLVVAAAFVVIASFLQGFVGYCLGCQVYLLLVRGGLIRPKAPLYAPADRLIRPKAPPATA